MQVQQIYTKCLSEASYVIISEGEAAIIDPIRDTAPYLELVSNENARIKYIFETHFHADFVSGHLELAQKTGAQIIYGPSAQAEYAIYTAKDLEVFELGKLQIEVLHTPGHTMESSCFLLYNEAGKPKAVFTGDTLFIGEVGRPDLAVKSDLSVKDLAGFLYHSLNTKIKTLPNEVTVYPGHGAGSACGKNIGRELQSTIGQQKQTNYALQDMPQEKFIELVTEGLLTPPSYFFDDVRINKTGYLANEKVMSRSMCPLSITEAENQLAEGALLLDIREPEQFEKGFIKGSVNIGLSGQFAIWAGTLLSIKQPIILVTENESQASEAIIRLARVGYENVSGFLEGGFKAWHDADRPKLSITSVEAKEAVELIRSYKVVALDVREPSETLPAHVADAINIRLQNLPSRKGELNESTQYLVYCAGGYRSMIACSLLRSWGLKAINVKGGYSALKDAGAPSVFGKLANNLKHDPHTTL